MKKIIGLIFMILGLAACSCSHSLASLESQYVEYSGTTVHFKSYGDGPRTIAFIHGFGCDVNCWENQFQEFKHDKDIGLVFVDMPGYGLSGKPEGADCTLQYFADAVSTVLDSLRTGPAVLVGHNLGTPVSMKTTGKRWKRCIQI